MELDVMKKLVKRHQLGHQKMVRASAIAERYYRKQNDIIKNGTKRPEESGNPLHAADNRIPSNFYNILVNQKASYLFTSPPMFDVGNGEWNNKIVKVLGDDFAKVCKDLCINASNSAVAWLHYWVDDDNGFQYAVIDSKQIIPVWTSGDLKKQLSGLMRVYDWVDEEGETLNVYEYWDKDKCWAFAKEDRRGLNTLSNYPLFPNLGLAGAADQADVFPHGFGEVPFIPFFNNAEGGNDLNDIKELIDAYDKVYSGFLNDLEDIQEVIFVLSGYEGESLKEFLEKLKKYKTIKLDRDEDGKGGLSTLTVDIPVEAREKMLALTRKAIFEQGMGIDPDPQNFGNSSGVALSYLYSLLELKAGLMETEFRSGFNRLIRAVNRYLGIAPDTILQTWARTSVRNDTELAAIAQQSTGIISRRTVLANHPWVDDVDKEIKQIEEEEQEEQEEMLNQYNPFGQQTKNPAEPNQGNQGGGVDEE